MTAWRSPRTGSGERLWLLLNNPPRIMVSAFSDNNPRGFGLLQRDRVFDHYLDGVFYDRRPSLWVEPLAGPSGEGWGKGSIQLCEIPTDDYIPTTTWSRAWLEASQPGPRRRRAQSQLSFALARR